MPSFLPLGLVAYLCNSLHHVFHRLGSRSFWVLCVHGFATHYGAHPSSFFLKELVFKSTQLLYSIVLLCLGRHPLQNPHYIKPEIGKLPKSVVDRIPLVIYIPHPPDDAGSPISLPKPVHSYPPKPPTNGRTKRFAFLPHRVKKGGTSDTQVGDKRAKPSKPVDNSGETESWEDSWEQCDYPFVRLDGNRAACAICLMDFEEPSKRSTVPDRKAAADRQHNPPQPMQEVEIPVERITEEERDELPRLQDAGEGPQPLRLLACGHVFHVRRSVTIFCPCFFTCHTENLPRPVAH